MTKDLKQEDKPVFGVNGGPDGFTIVVGITDASWEYCKDSKTLVMDFNKTGLCPVKLIIFGCRNQEEAKRYIFAHNEKQDISSMFDKRDFGIKEGAMSKASLKNKIVK